MSDLDTEATCPFDLSPEGLAQAPSYYQRVRAEEPVTYVESIGAWVVARQQDIVAVLQRPETFSSRYATGPRYTEVMRRAISEAVASPDTTPAVAEAVARSRWEVLLTADPPLHDRQRKLVSRGFSPRQVAVGEPAIQAIVERLVDGFASRGSAEVMTELAIPLPLEVIANRLGVPTQELDTFKRWSDDISSLVGNHDLTQSELVRSLTASGEFYRYFMDKLKEVVADPKDDIITKVATAELPGGDRLSEGEMLGMLQQFLVAGNETTTNLIGSAVLRLCRDPDLAEDLRGDPGKIESFVEEVLRLDSPTQGVFRMAKEDVVVGNVAIPRGAHLFLAYASANRDEDVYDCPADLEINRENKRHLAFGQGIHFCLGASLARQEARLAIGHLLARTGDLALAPEADIEYQPSYFLRGIRRLPVTFTPLA